MSIHAAPPAAPAPELELDDRVLARPKRPRPARPRSHGRLRRAARSRHAPTLLVFALYAAWAVFQTWPLATDPTGLIAGGSVGPDSAASTAQMNYFLVHHISPFAPAMLHGLNAPHGLRLNWVFNWIDAPSVGLLYGLSRAFGAVAGGNAFLWLSFVGSAMAMYLLCRRLFHHAGVAFLAGLVFGFFPFAVQQIGGHVIYSQGWVLVLGVWRLLELIDRPTVRNALWAGAAIAFAMWFTPYFILFGGLIFAVMCLVLVIVGRARGQGRRSVGLALLAGAPPLALLAGLGAFAAEHGGASADGLQTRGINEFFAFSSRPLEWLLPDRSNLVVGHLTRGYLNHHLHGSSFVEASGYVGVSVLVLAAVGVVWAVGRIRAGRGGEAVLDLRVVAVLAGALLALVAALFSLPPTLSIGHFSLALPESVVYLFTSTWRTVSRLVEVVELGLCLALAGGVARLLRGRGARAGALLVAGLAVVLVLDLWARPQTRAVSATPTAEYAWLADHPGGTVADYPLLAAAFPHYASTFWASFDHHPSFQGYSIGPDETLKLGLADPRDPTTASELAALGVRYVVTHPGQAGGDPASMRRRGYVLRDASPHGDVYAVRAAPAIARVDATANFDAVQGPPGREVRWLNATTGTLQVTDSGCARCTGTVRFSSRSWRRPRVLTVRDATTGAVLARRSIPAGRSVPVRVAHVALSDRRADLILRTDIPPGTTPDHGHWPGPVSVTVQMPRFTPAGR